MKREINEKYRSGKVTPKMIVEMKKLRKNGIIFREIGDSFGISMNTVMYHLSPKYKKSCLESTCKYQKKRYNNDEEFRKRFRKNQNLRKKI